MSTKTYTGLKTILINKLTAIQSGGSSLLAGVYGVSETVPTGYPCAYVLERTGKGQIIDTHRNEREWQFSVVVHQEIGNKTPETAYVALLDAVDKIITAFDTDPLLLDGNGQEQCKWCRVVPVSFDYANQPLAVHRALLTVAIVDIVSRYA
jgi:hypothetical protein